MSARVPLVGAAVLYAPGDLEHSGLPEHPAIILRIHSPTIFDLAVFFPELIKPSLRFFVQPMTDVTHCRPFGWRWPTVKDR